MTFPIKFLLSAVLAATPMIACAYNVSGTIVDENDEALPDATARILNAKDSTYVKGCAANLDGKFVMKDIKSGKYILEATYIGYNKSFTDFTVEGKNLNLGKISMTETSHLLSEAVVTGVKTPIKVMEDTIEFNADSYKSQPNAVVEDLLKRLPGVEVDTEGKITANGKQVTKILVDGKEFFSDDPKVASKNLPVSMVDKLQVVDRKSDLARLTGVDDGEEETVINLTVKKGMQNGWFGTVEAGYGTDDRYLGTFNVNKFWNGNQLTFIGNANNTNQMGFTDGSGQRFRRFGGDQGINNTQSFGINFNVGNEEILRVGGNVMYSHSDKDTRKRQNRQYLLDQDSYTQNSIENSRDKGHNVRSDFRIEWKPDSFNTLDVRPYFNYNQNNSLEDKFSLSQGKNMSFNHATSDGKSYEAGGRVIYNHNFNSHRGRSLSAFVNYRMSNVHEYEDSYVKNMFFQDDTTDEYDQYIDNKTWSNFVSGRLTWTEPLGNVVNGNFLTVGYSAQMRWNNADKLVYERPVVGYATEADRMWSYIIGDSRYDYYYPVIDNANSTLDTDLSNRFRNTNFQQDMRVGYKKVSSKYTLDAGLSLVPIVSKSTNLINSDKNIPTRHVWNFAPYLRFRYKFDNTTSLNIDYNGRSSQPSMTQLQPVADYSNPLNIVIGNPELLPTFNHNIRIRQQHFNPDAQRSIMTMMFATLSQNSIISRTDYDMATGGRTTRYENVNGIWSLRLMNMFSQPLRNKAFTFNNNIFIMYNRNIGYNMVNGDTRRNVSNSIGVGESFSFAFRPDNLEIELRPNYFYQGAFNSLSSLDNTNVHRFGGNLNITYYTPIDIILSSELTMNATRGYASGYNEDSWMWNASISYQFLKGKQATVMLKAYDLLQQKKDINRTITASYIDDTQYNALTRYFMVSFVWKFNSFAGGAMPQDRNHRGFGPPPGGPGPRR